MTGTLRRVLVRPPMSDFSRWREYGWLAEPDAQGIADEHEGFCKTLEEAGAEVVVAAKAADRNPDAVYVFDPAFVTDAGAILLRPGKEARRSEVEALRADFEAAGVPIAAELTAPALAEGGDAFWLDEQNAGRRPRLPDERGGRRRSSEPLCPASRCSPSICRTTSARNIACTC